MHRYRQFFYCKRAEYLYSKLSSALRADVRVRPNEKRVVNAIGYILSHSLDDELAGGPARTRKRWICDEPVLRSGYLKFAVRYYSKAIALDPDDSDASCGMAMARVSLDKDDMEPLETLDHSAAAHYTRGLILAHGGNFKEALENYAAAITEGPSYIDALNNFAYTLYLWHLEASLNPKSSTFPDAEMYARAREYAATAGRLTEKGGDQIRHRIIESTVGEVELACGDAENAVKVLKHTLEQDPQNPTGIEHPFFDEIRWDLAQAYVCRMPSSAADAERELELILEAEKSRLDQRFLGPPDDGFLKRNLKVLSDNCAFFSEQKASPGCGRER